MAVSSKYDFHFESSYADRFVFIIFGFLMYCMSIAFMSGIFTWSLTNNWEKSLKGQLTIEFPASPDGSVSSLTEKQSEEVLTLVQGTPGVLSIRRLKEADILKILEPWLGSTAVPDDFPFPSLFDVETDRTTNIDLLDLTSKLSKVSQGVRIHNHANWYAPIAKISYGLFGFSVLLMILILFTVCITIVFITKKTLGLHRDVVKILQLIGAKNEYIASQFKKYYLSIGLKGTTISVFFSMVTIFCLTYFVGGNWINLNNIKYLIISLVVPLTATLIIMLTSKTTVLYYLKNEDWVD